MLVGCDFGLLMRREGAPPVLQLQPALFLLAHLTLLALAGQAHHVSALVGAYPLVVDLLPANPTVELLLLLLDLQLAQLLQGEFVFAARAVDDSGFFLDVVDVEGRVFEGPEGCLDVVIFLRVEFVDAGRLDFLDGDLDFLLFLF